VSSCSTSCRDGLSEPPASRKHITNTTATADKSKAEAADVDESLLAKTNPKKAPARSDQALQQLETLHESTNVKKSIGIRDGNRLKLDNYPSSPARPTRRRPKAPLPNFELTFADLDDNPLAGKYNLDEDDDDDDDLPDIHDLLHPTQTAIAKPKRTSSPVSNYSNSEIDALIRDIPLDGFGTQDDKLTLPSLDSNFQASRRNTFNAGQHYRPSTPLPYLKRVREPENESPAERVKRVRDSTRISPANLKPVRKVKKVWILVISCFIVYTLLQKRSEVKHRCSSLNTPMKMPRKIKNNP
jgi:ATP-dependent DNA helicase HFM1/MER3